MASNNMSAKCTNIEESAKQIALLNEKYTSAYKSIFDSFRKIDDAWNGEDNDSYNERVMSFEKDFVSLTDYIERVEKHLKMSSNSYKLLESVNLKSAKKLPK